jgi:hypothetical protein
MYFIGHLQKKSNTTSGGSQSTNKSQRQTNDFPNVQRVTELLYIFNHSINFFLYIVTRNSFRRVLKEKLKCDCLNWKLYMNNMNKSTNALLTNCTLLVDQPNSSAASNNNNNSHTNNNHSNSKSNEISHHLNDQNQNNNQEILQPENYETYWDLVTTKNLVNNQDCVRMNVISLSGKNKQVKNKNKLNVNSKFETLKKK